MSDCNIVFELICLDDDDELVLHPGDNTIEILEVSLDGSPAGPPLPVPLRSVLTCEWCDYEASSQRLSH